MSVNWLDQENFGHVQGGPYNGRLVHLQYDDNTGNVIPVSQVKIEMLMDQGWRLIECIKQGPGEMKGKNKEDLMVKARNVVNILL